MLHQASSETRFGARSLSRRIAEEPDWVYTKGWGLVIFLSSSCVVAYPHRAMTLSL